MIKVYFSHTVQREVGQSGAERQDCLLSPGAQVEGLTLPIFPLGFHQWVQHAVAGSQGRGQRSNFL